MRYLRLFLMVILALLVIVSFSGCPEVENALGVEITNIVQTMDTVTITFSDEIQSITMPNTVEFESGAYSFEIYKDGVELGDYGLLSSSANSFTIALLGQTETSLSAGTYELQIFIENEDSDIVVAEQEFEFSAWSGYAHQVDIFNTEASDYILVQMIPNDAFTIADFTIFNGQGNKVTFTRGTMDGGGDEYKFEFNGTGKFWVRFAKTGCKPSYDSFTR